MARTFVRQATQIRKSDTYSDVVTPSQANYETNTVNIEDDLNSLRSQINNLLNRNGASFPSANGWYGTITAPSSFEDGKARGVNEINQQLHDLERKRVLVASTNLADVTVGAGNNFVILGVGQLPTKTITAVGSATTITGSVAAHVQGTFGAWSADFVTGSTNIAPKNLCEIVEGSTRDQILSDNRVVYALFQSENSTSGHTMTTTTPNRVQLSFVRINSAGDNLEAVPAADIQGKTINYASVERKPLEGLSEQDFLRGAILDNAGTTTLNRQNAYDNQGTTAIELANNATLDIGSGFYWQLRDKDNNTLFRITDGAGLGTTTFLIDTDVDNFDVNAVDIDFSQGAKFDTGGTRIDVGMNAGVIETTATADLRVLGAGELYLDDGNQAGSSWAQTNGIKLSDTTLEWTEFENAFGSEMSLLKAVYQSKRRSKVYAIVNTTVAADTDVSFAAGNIGPGELPQMLSGSFTTDYDVYLNGQLLFPGANAGEDNDYYPGSTGDGKSLRFEFSLKANDVICVVPYTRD